MPKKKAPAAPLAAKVGDLVELGGVWEGRRGIVLADDAWYLIEGHLDVSHCIAAKDDVVAILKERAVDPEMLPYLRHGGVRP